MPKPRLRSEPILPPLGLAPAPTAASASLTKAAINSVVAGNAGKVAAGSGSASAFSELNPAIGQ